MYNNKEISLLSREELIKALQKYHLKCGPITQTTRKIFENRLRAHLEKCNAEVESKEDKENWNVDENKCFNGFKGSHENLKIEENGVNIKQINNFDYHLVPGKTNNEQSIRTEVTLISTETIKSPDTLDEKLVNGHVSDTANSCSQSETRKNTLLDPLQNAEPDTIGKPDKTIVAHCVLDSSDSGPTYNTDKYIKRTDQVNPDVNIVVNVSKSEIDLTVKNAVVPDNFSNNVTHSGVIVNDVQKIEEKKSSLNENSTVTEETSLVNGTISPATLNKSKSAHADGKNEETVSTTDNESNKTLDKININNNSENISETKNVKPFYYGIWIPHSSARVNGSKAIVCESQKEALQKMKGFKGSRFKVFECKMDAEKFSLSRTIQSCEKKVPSPPPPSPAPSPPVKDEPKERILKCPSFQEIIKFRQHIEKFKSDEIEACLDHPRYLVSANDIPVILQEGSRMNAVHIATKCNRVKVLKMIFSALQSKEFLQLAYFNAPDEHLEFRKNHLLDLYLNTPEKILCDTPLHMACKFGFTNVVKFLLTFKDLKVDAENTDRMKSIEVICDRVSARTPADKDKIKTEILALFEARAYVPLYDNEDGTQSKIGEPIVSVSPNEIYSSRVRVKAYAGPMSPDQAKNVFEKWKKSPRNKALSVIARSDYEKGMERIGRTIATEENVPFTEYWPFLDKYANLATSQGLKKLEKYLKSKYTSVIQNSKKENGSSTSNGKKRKNGRRSNESLDKEIDKNPNDIKRKLTFDDAKPRNKFSMEKKKNFKNKSSTNLNPVEIPQQSLDENRSTSNQLTVVPSQHKSENSKNIKSNDKTIGDEKSCPLKESSSNVTNSVENIKNVLNNKIKTEPVNEIYSLTDKTNTKDIHVKEVESKIISNLMDCTPNNVTAYSFCEENHSQNILPLSDENDKTNSSGHTLRCSPLLCLCDENISEECYLSEALSELDLNKEEPPKISINNLSEDGNVDMDLVNQSVSYQNKRMPLQNDGTKDGLNDDILCSTFKKMEINSDELNISSDDSFANNKSCMEKTLSPDDKTSQPASSICPVPSLSLFECSDIPASSYNSPLPTSSFENKVAIPGIINLPGKMEMGVDSNGSTEHHSVFIDGEHPSKQDLDVLRAIGPSDISNYPHIRRWKCLIESYSDDTKCSWPSPGSPRYSKTMRRTLWTA